MSSRFVYVKYICAAILVLLIIVSIIYLSARKSDPFPQAVYGVPAVYSSESDLVSSSIDQIVSDSSNLYILFGEHDGIVQIYDLNGNYKISMSFYSHLNGAFRLATLEDKLLVRDKYSNLYVFQDCQFKEFLPRDEASSLLESADFNKHSEEYFVRSGSVWRVSNGEEICIIQRPIQTIFYQGNVDFLFAIGLIFLLGCFRLYNQYKVKKRNKT